MKRLLSVGAAWCLLFCAAHAQNSLRVLSVGVPNDDPELVRHLSELTAQDGTVLSWNCAETLSEVSGGAFDAVVLGQALLEKPDARRQLRRLRRHVRGGRLLLHQDWAWAVDYFKEPCIEPAFAAYGYDQQRMYAALVARSRETAARFGLELLPVGTAVQNVRATFDRDNLTRDGVHLNHSIGCFLAACTWYEALTGRDVTRSGYGPDRLTAERAALARGAAHAAWLHPFEVTDYGFRHLDKNYDEALVPDYTLPDALTMQDGTPVRDAAQWYGRRRPELLALFEREMYGRMPGRPEGLHFQLVSEEDGALGGTAVRKEIRICFDASGGHYMTVLLYLPRQAEGPVPVVVGANFHGNTAIIFDTGVSLPDSAQIARYRLYKEPFRGQEALSWPVALLLSRGYGLATFFKGDLDPEWDDGFTNGVQPLFYRDGQTCPDPDQWGAIGAWAWGYSRVLDYLETDPAVDAKRVITAGHSRLAKTALWAAVADPRFAMAFPNNSGCCGAAISRRRYGESLETMIRHYHYWYCANFAKYAADETALPFDQHELIALMAPRPVYVTSGSEDRWSDPRGEFIGAAEAARIYEFLGLPGLRAEDGSVLGPDDMPPVWQPRQRGLVGYHLRQGPHALTGWDWARMLDFADRWLGRR
ncbi:MAG: DUF4886 domain-containing protein [Bacteroidales bacterium]|nr:DUF4886 domain-containing protein [Bacteroidales bacterium]